MIRLIKFEVSKILNKKTTLGALGAIIIILFGIFYIGFHYSHLGLVNRNNSDKGYPDIYWEKSYKFEGELTDENISELLSDYITDYQNLPVKDRPFDLYSSNIADVFFSSDQEDVYIRMNDAMEKGELVTINDLKINKISEVGFTHFTEPLKMGSYITWSDLYKVVGVIFVFASIVAILISSKIFSGDTSINIDSLLTTTKFGKTLLPCAKIITGVTLSVGFYWMLQLITCIAFYFYNRGWSGWDTSIQYNFVLQTFSFLSNLNNLQILLLQFIFYTFSVIAISSVTLLVSALNKSTVVSLVISVGLFLLPLAMTQIFREGLLNHFLYILPINNYSIENFLTIFDKGNILLPFSFQINIMVICFIFFSFSILINKVTSKKIKGL
ncbi:hypothetical protein [Streptococcus sp. A22]|uniref:hypothetical protein n=1 Tax=Streptococcus sp. A22 TaxID=3373126 RepID=UPI00374D1868